MSTSKRSALPLAKFEIEVLRLIECCADDPCLSKQLSDLLVIDRTSTGAGVFLDFSVPRELDCLDSRRYERRYIDGPNFLSSALKEGGGSLLWMQDGYVDCLEIYGFMGSYSSDLSSIDDYQFTDIGELRIYELDGREAKSLEQFLDMFSTVVLTDHQLSRNLNAFNDVLRGGFGSPENGFILRWKNSNVAIQNLGYEETKKQLQRRLRSCHSDSVERTEGLLTDAENEKGDTVFDWLVEIIRDHGPGGVEAEDNVRLVLS